MNGLGFLEVCIIESFPRLDNVGYFGLRVTLLCPHIFLINLLNTSTIMYVNDIVRSNFRPVILFRQRILSVVVIVGEEVHFIHKRDVLISHNSDIFLNALTVCHYS